MQARTTASAGWLPGQRRPGGADVRQLDTEDLRRKVRPLVRPYLEEHEHTPNLGLTVGTCSGFQYDLREMDRQDLEDHLIAANKDDNVDGIIVYYPIHGNRQDQYLQQIPAVDKDVEGLNHRYIFNMYQNIRFLDDEQQKKSILVRA